MGNVEKGDERWYVTFSSWPSEESKLSSQTLRTKRSNLQFNMELQGYKVKNQTSWSYCTLWINITKKDPVTFGNFALTIYPISVPFIFDNKPVGNYPILALEKGCFIPKNELQIAIGWEWKKEEALNALALSKLTENFTWLLESGEFSDGVIVTKDGTRFPFHKSILAARSPVFLAMFKSGMQEAESKCVEITDLSADTVKNMLMYLYSGCIKELPYDSYAELLKAADKYNIPNLKQLCAAHLLLLLNTSNAVDLLLTMDLYRMEDSKGEVMSYITNNRKYLSQDGAYDALQCNPKLLVELLQKMSIV